MSDAALVLAPFSQEALEVLRDEVTVIYESWTDTRRLHSPEELAQRINLEGIRILVVEADFVFEEVFEQAPPLRFLGLCRGESNHVDVEAATAHGVMVVNSPGRNAQAVAELTIGLMLCLARGIPRLDVYTRGGTWEDPVEPYISMRGIELSGRTLGVLGLGAVGRKVARLARAFGMRVLAYDPYVVGRSGKAAGADLQPLDQVLSRADFVSAHVPDTAETRGLLNTETLGLMKRGSYIVNTAAYTVIDEAALVEGLCSGHIVGAALDVHRTHPSPPNNPLAKLDNVILTPHIGGASDGTIERQSWMMVEEIRRFLRGRKPRSLVNPEVWSRGG